ncbi:unnamed protein product [Ostreobium quekettii]|uniref:ARID domain-containing protein n=1 Tax=Ostreobium quekettii TaxID=121088 RepID=A0A8S1JHP0_9CHLO|nr:unnamed protein product [Ostreobium quekettii]
MRAGRARWRVLAARCHPGASDGRGASAEEACRAVDELAGMKSEEVEVCILSHPTLEELGCKLKEWRPQLVYMFGGIEPNGDQLKASLIPLSFKGSNEQDAKEDNTRPPEAKSFSSLFDGADVTALYIDAPISQNQLDLLQVHDIPYLICWPDHAATSSVVAAQFSHTFMAMLRSPSASICESFALASRVVQMLCESIVRDRPQVRLLPQMISQEEPRLPDSTSVPTTAIPGVDFCEDGVPDVEGWEDVRLLAPKAELKLLVCGSTAAIDAKRLSYLGEALRALLLMEMRLLTVVHMAPCERVPSHLTNGCTAIRCDISSASGANAVVVLGGPPAVLSNQMLVQHALRQTLVVDSLCLQFRLPPPGVPAPAARSSSAIAGGTPVVDTQVVTSVWAVQVLRCLCQDSAFRGLVSMGIAGVGGSAVTNFKAGDTARFNTLVTGMQPESGGSGILCSAQDPSVQGSIASFNGSPAPPGPLSAMQPAQGEAASPMEVDGADGGTGLAEDPNADIEGNGVGWTRKQTNTVNKPSISGKSYKSNRPSLDQCTEQDFLGDLIAFLQERRGKVIDLEKFPEAVLNGVKLDLFNLYREVCSRGGFRVGNGINWKGQVFPQMRNWTEHHRMTGVGNALKRHYQTYLWEYEQVHPEDVIGDRCSICGGGDEVGTDWICCDGCQRWAHFGCDQRDNMGTFKDYATGEGRNFYCPRCHERGS